MKFCPPCLHLSFHLEIVRGGRHSRRFTDGEFRENRLSGGHVLLRGVNECLSSSSTFISRYSVVGIVTRLRA